MNRFSARIGAAVAAVFPDPIRLPHVKCPGCKESVVPTGAVPDETPAAAATQSGKRWSFVWRPPSGEVCPSCGFPLDRYVRRVRWIRILRIGVVTLVLALLLLMVDRYAEIPSWIVVLYKALGIVGIVAFLVAGTGLVVGGKHVVPQ